MFYVTSDCLFGQLQLLVVFADSKQPFDLPAPVCPYTNMALKVLVALVSVSVSQHVHFEDECDALSLLQLRSAATTDEVKLESVTLSNTEDEMATATPTSLHHDEVTLKNTDEDSDELEHPHHRRR